MGAPRTGQRNRSRARSSTLGVGEFPGIDLEDVPMRPSEVSLAGHMTVSYSGPGAQYSTHGGAWQGIGEWYEQLAKDRMTLLLKSMPKQKNLLQERQTSTKRRRRSANLSRSRSGTSSSRWVSGESAPLRGEIFQHRYGDCRSSDLLSAMLSSAGVHSTLMMVDDRRGVVDPDVAFNMGRSYDRGDRGAERL